MVGRAAGKIWGYLSARTPFCLIFNIGHAHTAMHSFIIFLRLQCGATVLAWHRPLSEQVARPVAARRPVGGAAGSGAVDGGTVGGWRCAVAGSAVGARWWCSAARRYGSAVGGGAADSSAVGCPRRCHRCCCRCRARPCRAACPKRTVAPAGGRNGSRIAMCRAHSHAVPHTRTVEHDQHWQRSLRWMRKALQNDEPEIGLCEPRLRFLLAEAMQAMQAAAMLRSAPQKPMMIIHEDHHSIHRLSCHHLSTATTSGSAKEHKHPIEAVVVIFEQPGQGLTRRHHDVV